MTYSVCSSWDRVYNFVAFLGMLFTYFPEKYIVLERESKMQTLKKIDWLGAVLSISGITIL
jgi:hypothetical protein